MKAKPTNLGKGKMVVEWQGLERAGAEKCLPCKHEDPSFMPRTLTHTDKIDIFKRCTYAYTHTHTHIHAHAQAQQHAEQVVKEMPSYYSLTVKCAL